MARDTRKGQKTNRKKVVKEVSQAQQASGVKPPTPKRRPSRALDGADKWMRKMRNTLTAKAARDLFDMVGDPDQSSLQLANKLLTTQTFLLMQAQQMLDKQMGKPGEDSARLYLEDCRRTARMVKDMASAIVKLRAQYASENLDTNPDVIELVGVETLRSQLTTATSAAGTTSSVH